MTDERFPIRDDVFAMLVTAQFQEWPEKGRREVEWFTLSHAAALVAKPALARVIRKVAKLIRRKAFIAACVELTLGVGGHNGVQALVAGQ